MPSESAPNSPPSRDDVVRQVQDVLADVLNLDDPPALEARLVEDLGAQSVDVISLLFELEERLGRRIPDEEVIAMTTVADVVEQVLAVAGGDGRALAGSGSTT